MFDKLDGALARKLGLTEPLPTDKTNPHNISVGGVLDPDCIRVNVGSGHLAGFNDPGALCRCRPRRPLS